MYKIEYDINDITKSLYKKLNGIPSGLVGKCFVIKSEHDNTYNVYTIICKTKYESYREYNIVVNRKLEYISCIQKRFCCKPCGLIYTYTTFNKSLTFYKKSYEISTKNVYEELQFLAESLGV